MTSAFVGWYYRKDLEAICARQHFCKQSKSQVNNTTQGSFVDISCPKQLTSFHHTVFFSVGNMVIQCQHVDGTWFAIQPVFVSSQYVRKTVGFCYCTRSVCIRLKERKQLIFSVSKSILMIPAV